jgi:hypothetical protein
VERKRKARKKERGEKRKEREKRKGIILFIFKNYDSQILIYLLLLHNEK